MEAMGMEGFSAIFSGLDDPRTGNARRHDLCEVLMIALCSCLCGGTTCTEMAEFAQDKEPFLRDFLDLKNGLPSHDTFSRLFRLLDPVAFGDCFSQFMQEFSQQTSGLVAVDGKTLRRSFDTASAKSALPMVSAWSCEERLVLAQIAADEKSNEITAVPQLLRLVNLEGRTVTADAMSCQREIAQQIVDQGGQYVLSLKGNQPTLFDDVARYLADPEARVLATLKPTVDADHGRIETRSAVVSYDVDWLQDIHHWPGLKAIGAVRRTRELKGANAGSPTTETAYYLLSEPITPERLNQAARDHWGVENRLHWVLDVEMNDDQARNRRDNGPRNLAIVKHLALNALNAEPSKLPLRRKMKKADRSDAFLRSLLAI
jgi:predicted transposase YbfD/YdcC